MARIWDDFLTERDQEVFGAAGYGREAEFKGRPALLVHQDPWSLAAEGSYYVGRPVEAAVLSQRRPWTADFVLCEAEREFGWASVCGSVDPTGLTATDVTDCQLDGPTDGQVRPIALAQNVDPRVHSDPLGDRSVHHEHRTDTHRGGQHPVHVEFVSADCLQRG